MQQYYTEDEQTEVVFTLQTAGRCNTKVKFIKFLLLFLPCKQQADATIVMVFYQLLALFLPCKQQADATAHVRLRVECRLFLPCKQQADAT